MSNNYLKELIQINTIYQWAIQVEIKELSEFVSKSLYLPLIAIGSGGSLTVAHLAAHLHESIGTLAKAATPFEISSTLRSVLRNSNIIVASASGKNKDILSAFRIGIDEGARNILGLCMQKDTPLTDISLQYPHTHVAEYSLSSGKDGFLATNSLIASAVLLVRAYSMFSYEQWIFPLFLPRLEETEMMLSKSDSGELLNKQTWIVLFGGWSHVAAVDLESKCTEAGLIQIQIADFRNFGHGRHHWLAKHIETTGIIALYAPSEELLATKTLAQLPPNIPQLHLKSSNEGATGSLEHLAHVFNIVELLGRKRRIDPGKPKVPEFGRRLYHLTHTYSKKNKSITKGLHQHEADAIVSKTKVAKITELSDELIEYWHTAYQAYRERLSTANFSAIVLDYDGTLCASNERYSGISDNMTQLLNEMLESGLYIAIATGRGDSVRKDLSKKVGREFAGKMLIGYYNGSDISYLNDKTHPQISNLPHDLLLELNQILNNRKEFLDIAQLQLRPNQLTIEPKKIEWWNRIKSIVLDILNRSNPMGMRLVESSHSIDILAPNISKKNLVYSVQKQLDSDQIAGKILCIGDRGEWPGNDFELLSTPYSLSVDSVSPDPNSCWNMNSVSCRGVVGTMTYLRALRLEHNYAHFDFKLRGGSKNRA